MTTIVYDHKRKQIACDSRMAKSNGSYSDSFIKMIKHNDSLFVMCGSTCDINYFIENFKQYGAVRDGINLDCSGFMIKDKCIYEVFESNGVFNIDDVICDEYSGSGGKFAISALDHGKTAKEAVEYAMTKDCFTGGKVHVYDIEKGEFI